MGFGATQTTSAALAVVGLLLLAGCGEEGSGPQVEQLGDDHGGGAFDRGGRRSVGAGGAAARHRALLRRVGRSPGLVVLL